MDHIHQMMRDSQCQNVSEITFCNKHAIVDTATSQPPDELDETYASFLILANSLHYARTWRHPHNWKYIENPLPSEKDPATITSSCHPVTV